MNTPIYERALGSDFARLQPELQEYFSLAAGSGRYGVGEGVFDVVGCRQKWLRPLLRLTGGEEAFFPEYGEAYSVPDRKPCPRRSVRPSSLTARREIQFPGRTRLFHDTTEPSDETRSKPGLVDHVGRYRAARHRPESQCDPEGRLRGVSEACRLFLGPLRIPLPAAVDAKAYAEQWWERRRARRQAPDPGQGDPAADRPRPGLRGELRLPAPPLPWRRQRRRATLPGLARTGQVGEPRFSLSAAGPARQPPGSVGSGRPWRTTACSPASPVDGVTRRTRKREAGRAQLAPGPPDALHESAVPGQRRLRDRLLAAAPAHKAFSRLRRRRQAVPTGGRSAPSGGRRSHPLRRRGCARRALQFRQPTITVSTTPAALIASITSRHDPVTSSPGHGPQGPVATGRRDCPGHDRRDIRFIDLDHEPAPGHCRRTRSRKSPTPAASESAMSRRAP